ncbi:MAG: Asp-tRNA(Asn)/Glu-tRNA(Gln) amidotransferase subunit GatC [Candidatus Andersenbacteria bacterium]
MNQEIHQQDIERIARLGRLALTAQEQKKAAEDMSGILDNFSKIQHIDTTNVPMADDASGLRNVARPDQAIAECLCSTETLLAAVPSIKDGQIQVRAVFS